MRSCHYQGQVAALQEKNRLGLSICAEVFTFDVISLRGLKARVPHVSQT